ncbi:MAG: metal-dependent hydrolase [Segniliparus sp.]|uniref:metal-dependent hydrolase n=1 Tax=Segniliparus sp. TaxID=2804064 RepID=UPI003F2A40CA
MEPYGGAAGPERIKTRRIKFHYPAGSLERHYVQGDLVMSHLVASLSAVFPEGEEFFVRSVRRFADQVVDPALKQQVGGFIGQEVTHGREHRELNDRLQQMGYPTHGVDRMVRRGMKLYEKVFTARFCLAITAALEHYTAVLAETILTDERAQEMLGHTEVRRMLLWHAYEESEHRSVAFDVMRLVGTSERTRVRAMRFITVGFVGGTFMRTALSLARDRSAYNPRRLAASIANLRRSPFFSPDVVARIKSYTRPGFHPDDHGNAELLQHWGAELFGSEGVLAGNLR